MAGAITLDALAFVVWNVGTRPPLGLLRDIRNGMRDGRTLFIGTVSAIVGFIFVMAASVLLLPAIADQTRDLIGVEVFTFLVALAIEHLIGDDLRRLASDRTRTR